MYHLGIVIRWQTKRKIFLMSMLPDVYICTLRKTNAPILPEGTAKCTHLAPQKFTGDAILDKKGAIAKVKVLVEKVGQGIQE